MGIQSLRAAACCQDVSTPCRSSRRTSDRARWSFRTAAAKSEPLTATRPTLRLRSLRAAARLPGDVQDTRKDGLAGRLEIDEHGHSLLWRRRPQRELGISNRLPPRLLARDARSPRGTLGAYHPLSGRATRRLGRSLCTSFLHASPCQCARVGGLAHTRTDARCGCAGVNDGDARLGGSLFSDVLPLCVRLPTRPKERATSAGCGHH